MPRILNVQEIKDSARSRWGVIYASLAPELSAAITSSPRHVSCPMHGGVDGFRLFKDWEDSGGAICNTCGTFGDGISVLRWLHGWSFVECVEQIAVYLGLDIETMAPSLESGDAWRNDNNDRLRIDAIWKETIPDNGLLSRYLRMRGLSGEVPASIRLHPALEFFDKSGTSCGEFPVMCAPIQRQDGQMVSIHRTYLSADGSGKAAVDEPKKLVRPIYPGATRGAAIRLGPIAARICVTEGIETGLAVQESTLCTTLAAISAGNLERFDPPAGVRIIEIWADNDVSGAGQRSSARAFRNLSERGYIVTVKMSPKMGKDWLDIMNENK